MRQTTFDRSMIERRACRRIISLSTTISGIVNNFWSSFPAVGIAVVFGASGGIGSALAHQLREDKYFDRVIGFSRSSEPAIDLLNETSLREAAIFAANQGEIRLVLDATGFLHDKSQRPEKSWRDLDYHQMARSFALNTIGPALIMKHMLPLLPRQGKAVFATLSARVGSISDNRLGGWYSYRAAKAALNQLVRTASIELRRRSPRRSAWLYIRALSTRVCRRPLARPILTYNPQTLRQSVYLPSSLVYEPAIREDFLINAVRQSRGERGQPVSWSLCQIDLPQ